MMGNSEGVDGIGSDGKVLRLTVLMIDNSVNALETSKLYTLNG